MKNLRISKKNPSKILKILQVHPATYRYSGTSQPLSLTMRNNPASIISNIRQPKNIETHRDKSLRQSPSRSHKLIEAAIQSKNKKSRNRSLGSSQQAFKNQEQSTIILQFRNSHEAKPKNDYSPYVRRAKLRQSEKFLNFHSVSLGQKAKRQEKESKQKQATKALSRKKSGQQKKIQISQNCVQQKNISDNLQNAKKFLSQGQYRKSLYILKGNLQVIPNHLQSLFLSAVNWYHLEDRIKAVLFIEQILNINSLYSAECYKLAAVCYSKAMQYNKSLLYLQKCHNLYPDEVESYRLQGKIYSKVKRWQEASLAYQAAFELSQNTMDLAHKAICFQQLHQYSLSLQCYERITEMDQMTLQIAIKKMALQNKLHQYEECIQTYQNLQLKYSSQLIKQAQEYLYLSAYAFYKLKKYSKSLVIIDEALRQCTSLTKFHKLLMMIRIHERDIYEAFHLVSKVKEEPELKIIMKFIEGVIELIRRNYQYGIDALVSISKDLGFKLQSNAKANKINQQKGIEVSDQFLYEIRSIYLMFLSYGYFNIAEFQICKKLLKIQQSIGVPEYFELGFSYNLEMCEGIIYHLQKQFAKAEPHFVKASKMYENKLQPPFSLALNCLQLIMMAQQKSKKQELIKKTSKFFDSCKQIVDKQNNNTAASVYYFSSLLHGYLEEWKQALDCIDQSIQRSEDHYWRYFYVRGLLLACVHSFREAVNDLSLAIGLSGSTRPQCYLLRSKCLQIEGQGNQAFKDLQEYISLKPDDPEVHKYAGQILFENGAFEDSLVAFSHQTIPHLIENYDYFLTQSKSFFLLGKFKEAEEYMKKSQQLKFSQEIQFDILVIKILEKLVVKSQSMKLISQQVDIVFSAYKKMGRIFKQSDYHILKAICAIFSSKFEESISEFLLSIEQKNFELGQSDDQDEAGIAQNTKDLQTFNNQMKYNIVLCKLSQGKFEDALDYYKQIQVDIDQPYYGDYVAFRKLLNKEGQNYKKEEVFPNRNKLSNFLDKVSLTLLGKNNQQIKISMKLCVPFPKVQPPEIFPSFDKNLLTKLSVLNVERKPEAPWVLRQNNSIKFTEKIETYSRFQMEDSQNQSTSTYQMIPIDKSHIGGSQRSRVRQSSQLMLEDKKGKPIRLEK